MSILQEVRVEEADLALTFYRLWTQRQLAAVFRGDAEQARQCTAQAQKSLKRAFFLFQKLVDR